MYKRFIRILAITFCLLMAALFNTGCYVNKVIAPNEMGVYLQKGASIGHIVGPGRYHSNVPFSRLKSVDCSVKTVSWSDQKILTSDNQTVSFAISFNYHRSKVEEDLITLYSFYNSEAIDDDDLKVLVLSFVADSVKSIVPTKTLEQMLRTDADGNLGRTAVAKAIEDLLRPRLANCGIVLEEGLRVDDIGPNDEYLDILQGKANSIARMDADKQKKLELVGQQDVVAEQGKLDLAKAENETKVKQEQGKAFELSPELYEFERLKLIKDIIGKNDKIYFVPEGTDLTTYLAGGSSPIIPSGN